MSTRFFSQRDVEQDAPLERQQALLLAALRRADGAPVSYAELRDVGIEFPASVVSELELAGVRVERCYEHADGTHRVMGVRLDPAHDLAVRGVAVGDMAGRPWLAPAAFAVAAGIVLTLAIVVLTVGGGHGGRSVAPPRPRSAAHFATASISRSASVPAAHPAQTTPAAQTTPVSAVLATQLEARGHELLQIGQPADAVPFLRRALSATGESLGGCLQPASEQCLTYAYALYDLGRALLLSGSPAAAVGVLEHRLQIENQRPTVAAELESARRRLG
ncbi:MAG: hypothetical protein ACLQBY_12150 [Solirubrobacteraceae bacterium]